MCSGVDVGIRETRRCSDRTCEVESCEVGAQCVSSTRWDLWVAARKDGPYRDHREHARRAIASRLHALVGSEGALRIGGGLQ
jgi:hypothetical protein